MNRLLPLTGIRAFAALWVVFYHYFLATSAMPWLLVTPLVQKGYLGVELFFVLSGFILSYVHQKDFDKTYTHNVLQFYKMRLARILPAHYVVLAIILLFFTFKAFASHHPAAMNEPGDRAHLLYNILNIQAWGVTNSLQWNRPAWSISAEWFAYLLFPFLAFQTAKLKSAWSNLVVIVLCFAALFCTMQAFQMPTLNFLPAYSLYRVLFEFIIGCSLYNIYRSTGTLELGWLSILSVLGIFAGSFYYVNDLYLLACIVCLLFSLAHGKGMVANALSIKPAVYLGEISYSVYLVHDFLISRLKGFENSLDFFDKGLWLNLLVLAIYLVVVAISASGLYHYVEVPARNFIKTFNPFRKTVPG